MIKEQEKRTRLSREWVVLSECKEWRDRQGYEYNEVTPLEAKARGEILNIGRSRTSDCDAIRSTGKHIEPTGKDNHETTHHRCEASEISANAGMHGVLRRAKITAESTQA